MSIGAYLVAGFFTVFGWNLGQKVWDHMEGKIKNQQEVCIVDRMKKPCENIEKEDKE
jgi:hypothetical protein